ncbi:ureidoglycolate hydrolase [Aspergillus avenaceus]|uniref:Ureidoglycolate hydrolase n=1 Tax=Aspergillus avenaceus TaxID=36643 RepID=A0A5N6TXE2_ASPAV|nr:ureidoglycolate hydrolase [Aspergillus avenaceus]
MSLPTIHPQNPTTITPEPLTKESFAPFGTAIYSPLPISQPHPPNPHPPHNPPPVPANQGTALKYSPVSPLTDNYASAPSGQPAAARMSMFSCYPRTLREHSHQSIFDLQVLERHPFTTQTFTPVGLSSADEPWFLVIVAPSLKGGVARDGERTVADPPDLNNVRAFVARGGQAVTYGAGTWHAPMAVMGGRRVDFVVVQFVNGVDAEDVQEVAVNGVEVRVGGKDAKL